MKKKRNFGALTSKNLNYTFNGRIWELDINVRKWEMLFATQPYLENLAYVSMLTHEHVYIEHFDDDDNQLSLELTLLQNAGIITIIRKFTDKQNDLLPVVKTIETVVKDLGDSIKDNLPIIAGIVGVGVVIYLVWSNWPPRKGPNKAPDNPKKPKIIKKLTRAQIRQEIQAKYGEQLKDVLDRYMEQPGYEALYAVDKDRLGTIYDGIFDKVIERLGEDMFQDLYSFEHVSQELHDNMHGARLNLVMEKFEKFFGEIDNAIVDYHKGIADGSVVVNEITFLNFFEVALPAKLSETIILLYW